MSSADRYKWTAGPVIPARLFTMTTHSDDGSRKLLPKSLAAQFIFCSKSVQTLAR